jgi:RNA-dependent RNA polymerase
LFAESRQLALSIPVPIHYFWRLNDVSSTLKDDSLQWSINETWHRATGICDGLRKPLDYPVSTYSSIPDCDSVDIGRLNAFRFTVNVNNGKNSLALEDIIKGLEDMHVNILRDPVLEIQRYTPNMWQMLDHTPTAHITKAVDLLFLHTESIIHLEFSVRYRLEVCVTRGFLNEYAVDAKFLQKLSSLEPSLANRRLDLLIDKEIPLENPMNLFEDPSFNYFMPKQRVPHHCAMVYKVHLTPTALKLNPPHVESSNRVMRKYSSLQDRFLRVQFLEETESGRIAKDRHNNEDVWIRLLRALYRGIRIGDRTFEFLAFGNSQIREGSVTFFAPTSHVSCDDIREWLGDFSHIRNVAKFGARIGQCFSTSREIRGINMPAIRYIEDIERNGLCFTDGIGVISEMVAKFIVNEMALDVVGGASAFQFRMGGCKGVLAVWPPRYATKTQVLIRKSQEKFTCRTNNLEIIRCARASTATLNRQTIVILEHLGVTTAAFMSLLEQQINRYEEAVENTGAAIEMLTTFVDENQTTLILAELLKYGFQDQFVTNLLTLWKAWSLKLIKEKARVHVEKSAFVTGVVDETGLLRGHSNVTEGDKNKNTSKLPQIFLQLSSTKHRKAQIVQGVCIIGRNPSLHAGDIRVVQAVNQPKLRHLKDVVVFPSTGDKPLPSMLSGGDLDGDDFFVIWEPSLIPKRWNTPPMPIEAVSPALLDRDVNIDDLRNFVVQYMKNDSLPLIATAHLAFADSAGVNSAICKYRPGCLLLLCY